MSRTGKRWFKALEEITDPDFIWGALDNVHDAETTLADYAASVSRAQRAALAASMAAPDCHQPDLVTAEAEQPVARLVEAARWARNRLETIADDCWHGDARDFKRSLVGVFADFDEAMANCGSHVPPEIRTVTPALEVQPLTVQDAARVPEIAALIEARRRYIGLVETYNSKLNSVKTQRLRGDWSQDTTSEFCKMRGAHRNFIAAAQTAADAALRAIAEGRA